MPETPAVPDYSESFNVVTDHLTAMQGPYLIALGVVVALALGVIAVTWGFPRIAGFFKKNAK